MRACAASAYLKSSAEQKGSLNVKERLPADRKRRSISVLGYGRVQRRPEIDALRGAFLVWMTLTHLPTHLSDLVNEPFGFVSSAEGFVFLSAHLAFVFVGLAFLYGTVSQLHGFDAVGLVALTLVGLIFVALRKIRRERQEQTTNNPELKINPPHIRLGLTGD